MSSVDYGGRKKWRRSLDVFSRYDIKEQSRLMRHIERIMTPSQRSSLRQDLRKVVGKWESTRMIDFIRGGERNGNVDELLICFAIMIHAIHDNAQCGICLETMTEVDKLSIVKTCRHTFCKVCIERWTDIKEQCPICRCDTTNNLCSLEGRHVVLANGILTGVKPSNKRKRVEMEQQTYCNII